ncbi:MAG: hypothetical protein QF733_06520 [Phycisphaerales bacterium]|jgi:hypothetical protein|nr:hypothetical protein [Phycisphaerales bacterium]
MMRTAFILITAASACGDSGLVRLSQPAPPWRVTVMTDPTPLRAGPIDVSVLLQEQEHGATVLDAEVTLELAGPDGLLITTRASRDQADNRLLYAAKFTLPASGAWDVTTSIARGQIHSEVDWAFTAMDPAPPFASAWPWLLPAPLGIGLFACNRALRRTRSP